jgi:hypothetical protein
MITLSEQNLAELKGFINKIPTEIGMPLLQFFNDLEKQQAVTEVEEVKEEA